jgi:multidrug efflux pump subunit AcrB
MKKDPQQKSFRERLNISRLAIANPWLTICIWLAVSVAGLFAYSSLKYALFPDVTFPVVVVSAKAPLDNALDTEAQLTKIIEEPLKSIEGLEEIDSTTYPGQTVVSGLFEAGMELEASVKAVEAKLNQITLPPENSFEVIPFNLNESTAVSYVVKSDSKSLKELIAIAQKQIVPSISKLPGVLKVNLLGDPAPPETENNQDSSTITPTLVRFNGDNATAFQVIKQADANTLEVVDEVEKEIQKLQSQLPEIQLILAETQAKYIKEATQATIDDLLLAIILAVLVIFPFLRSFKATIIAALVIPISLLGTFIIMAIAGFNLETITLLALALTIGIVVDDAIVDVENISRRIEKGETPKEAAISGTDEIGMTVVASTLTIVAVFLPVAFIGGTIGKFFQPFGLTVSVAVLFSLFVARTLSPVLAIKWLRQSNKAKNNPDRASDSSPSFLAIQYRDLLHWSLSHRRMVVGIALFSFISGIALIPLIPQGFIPKLDRGEFNIIYTTPLPKLSAQPSAPEGQNDTKQAESASQDQSFNWLNNLAQSPTKFLLNRTRRIGGQLEQEVLKSKEVESVFTISGLRGDPTKGKLYVKLKSDRQLHTSEAQEQIRTTLPKIPGVNVSVEDIKFVDTGDEKPLKLALIGDDLKALDSTAQQIKARLQELPGFVDVSASGGHNTSDNIVEIERKNGQRAAYISANLSQGLALGDATEKVVEVAEPILPAGVRFDLEGDSARIGEIMGDFGVTLILSIVCILLLLVILFGSLLEPIVVGLSLPLSIVGAMLGLLITQSDFGMISLIGLIFLLGLVDKNAILLIDCVNQLRHSGLSRTEAIIETGMVRLRPIIMTSASAILGMLPIALGLGTGAELRQPMGVAMIGGLVTSTLLSLIVVPVIYTLLDDLWFKLFKRRRFN